MKLSVCSILIKIRMLLLVKILRIIAQIYMSKATSMDDSSLDEDLRCSLVINQSYE